MMMKSWLIENVGIGVCQATLLFITVSFLQLMKIVFANYIYIVVSSNFYQTYTPKDLIISK